MSRRVLLRRPAPEDVRLGLLVAVIVAGVIALVGGLLIVHWYEPQDGLFGRPARLAACGRDYVRERDTTLTLVQVNEGVPAGMSATIFEPVIGQLPLGALFSGPRDFNGVQVCDTVVFLHLGPDVYAPFELQGGP